MKPAEYVGVIVARGIGLLLILEAIITGVGSIEPFVHPATSGWTSYSPLSTSPAGSGLTSVSFSTGMAWETWLHPLAQLVIGSAIILFSRVVGRWLAMGLKDSDIAER